MDFYLLLSQQKQALEQAELACKNQKQWMHKREEIEKVIIQLEEEIERDMYQKHSTLEDKRQYLHRLKQEQKQIDRWLDQWEDLNEETIEQQRNQLFYTLWQLYPENKVSQETKWKEWNHLRMIEGLLPEIKKGLERLLEHLNYAMQTRQSIQGRGILNYIFGTSPNSVIEQQFLAIQALIEAILPLIEQSLDYIPSLPLQVLLQHLAPWLLELKTTCRKSWSFRHLDDLFAKAIPSLKQFLDKLKQQQNQLLGKTQMLNKEMDGWIEEI